MAGLQKLHILLIESDDADALALQSFLAGEGYQVTRCGEPSRAVDELRRGRYQVVLLDLRPRGMDAVSLLDQIRVADSDVCVITTTARPSVESAVAVMKRGAFEYLQKPVKLDQLRRTMQDAIRENGLFVDLEQHLNGAVGSRIRERRVDRGLTLKQLANRTGLSVSLISQIELGKSAASVSTLHKLATALSVPMTYLFETV